MRSLIDIKSEILSTGLIEKSINLNGENFVFYTKQMPYKELEAITSYKGNEFNFYLLSNFILDVAGNKMFSYEEVQELNFTIAKDLIDLISEETLGKNWKTSASAKVMKSGLNSSLTESVETQSSKQKEI